MDAIRISRIRIWMLAALLWAPTLHAVDWSFVMLGDTRGVKDSTETGVSLELNTIAQKIAALSPDLVMVAGDLVNGNDIPASSALNDYSIQFANWKTAMQPVYNYSTSTGIPIYTVRGNHENMCSEGPTIPALKQAYSDALGQYMPQNWSATGNYTGSSQQGYTYSFTHNNVTFVAADQYFSYSSTDPTGYHNMDQTWVDNQFAASTTPFNVLMAHVPVFQTEGGGESEHFFGDTVAGNQTRADVWSKLGAEDVQLYLCGHIHNETVATTPANGDNTILQLMAGNGGAPLDPMGNQTESGVNRLFTNDQFGFSMATVSGDVMTISYYSLNATDSSWSVADYRTMITAPEPSSVVLLGLGMTVMASRWKFRRNRSLGS